MSRTDDLRIGGGNERAGSGAGGSPFVKWGDDYSWLEGEVTGTFTTKYGLAVTLKVQNVSENGLDTQGRDEDGNNYQGHVTVGSEVNIGMGSAMLQGKIKAEDMDKVFHVAFEGWERPKSGNDYRLFAVVELTERSAEGLETSPPDDRQVEDTSDNEIPF